MDLVAGYLESLGVDNYLVEIGGEVRVHVSILGATNGELQSKNQAQTRGQYSVSFPWKMPRLQHRVTIEIILKIMASVFLIRLIQELAGRLPIVLLRYRWSVILPFMPMLWPPHLWFWALIRGFKWPSVRDWLQSLSLEVPMVS